VTSPAFFDSAAQFRAWLERNHQRATELRVGFRKVSTGLPSMNWPESVEEALCFGWIDGVRKRIDDSSYMIRFTPRRRDSIWSAVNLAKMKILIAQGRVSPAGLAAYEGRKAKKTAAYSFEQERPVELAASEARQFKRNKVAWKFFESVAPSYRKVVTHWVVSAKKPETRARRLEELIGACAEGRRLLK
jgi:uncharacterized protein YdeI (YjbR/CyaY-like superfamily)